MTNLGPGVSSLGADTYKLLRLNSLNHYAIKQRSRAAEEALLQEQRSVLRHKQEFLDQIKAYND